MTRTNFEKVSKIEALSLSLHPEKIKEKNFRMAEPLDVINAAGKSNGPLLGSAITDGLLLVGSVTIKCIKLFSISLVH